MGVLSAQLFTFIQGAEIYRQLHRQAVELMPPGGGRAWFDIGCGPGLVVRMAAQRGYLATGWDIDMAMIRQALRLTRLDASTVTFSVAGLDALGASAHKADVVSATSLLAVLDDTVAAIRKLFLCLNEGGALLVIETTAAMKPRAAWTVLREIGFQRRNWVLLLWAWTRRNRRAVELSPIYNAGFSVTRTELLRGLVAAWIISRDGTRC